MREQGNTWGTTGDEQKWNRKWYKSGTKNP